MQLKSTVQTEHDAVADRVYAAMETGNAGQARTLLRELADTSLTAAARIRLEIVREYGIAL